jgi:hypothetical protein
MRSNFVTATVSLRVPRVRSAQVLRGTDHGRREGLRAAAPVPVTVDEISEREVQQDDHES